MEVGGSSNNGLSIFGKKEGSEASANRAACRAERVAALAERADSRVDVLSAGVRKGSEKGRPCSSDTAPEEEGASSDRGAVGRKTRFESFSKNSMGA